MKSAFYWDAIYCYIYIPLHLFTGCLGIEWYSKQDSLLCKLQWTYILIGQEDSNQLYKYLVHIEKINVVLESMPREHPVREYYLIQGSKEGSTEEETFKPRLTGGLGVTR